MMSRDRMGSLRTVPLLQGKTGCISSTLIPLLHSPLFPFFLHFRTVVPVKHPPFPLPLPESSKYPCNVIIASSGDDCGGCEQRAVRSGKGEEVVVTGVKVSYLGTRGAIQSSRQLSVCSCAVTENSSSLLPSQLHPRRRRRRVIGPHHHQSHHHSNRACRACQDICAAPADHHSICARRTACQHS